MHRRGSEARRRRASIEPAADRDAQERRRLSDQRKTANRVQRQKEVIVPRFSVSTTIGFCGSAWRGLLHSGRIAVAGTREESESE